MGRKRDGTRSCSHQGGGHVADGKLDFLRRVLRAVNCGSVSSDKGQPVRGG